MTKVQIIKAMNYWEIIACVQSEMGWSELRTAKRDLSDLKLLRKILKKLIRLDLEMNLHKLFQALRKNTVEVDLKKMTDSHGNCSRLFLCLAVVN